MEFYCPICKKAVSKPSKTGEKNTETAGVFPFCSKRCKLIDLNCWFDSGYVISSPLKEQEANPPNEPENML
ncbi:MAG: DNA gyrase inhibitor YacG [Phycisphaerae bacterium]|nr:DNA gyrase inhibitor YacG [Phycisphaerae bacterium]